MSYSVIAQQAFTDREVRCEETRVLKEREVYLGRKEKLPRKPVCSLPEKEKNMARAKGAGM